MGGLLGMGTGGLRQGNGGGGSCRERGDPQVGGRGVGIIVVTLLAISDPGTGAYADLRLDSLQAANAVVRAQQITEGIYDYVENVESGSTLSTPASSHTDELNPFAAEGLGDTVIHLDKVSGWRWRLVRRLSFSVNDLSGADWLLAVLDLLRKEHWGVGCRNLVSDVFVSSG